MSRLRSAALAAVLATAGAAGVASAGTEPEPPVKPDPGPSVVTGRVSVKPAKPDTVARVKVTGDVAWPDAAGAKVLGREASADAGAHGPVVMVSGAGRVPVKIDVAGLRNAYGGDWAARARLVRLADGRAMAAGAADGTLEARVAAGTYAIESAPAGGTGNFGATSLAPAGAWQVSNQTGDFTWSVPVGTAPPAPGGFEPSFALSYASGGVDGRIASTNNQASWVGEGWHLGTGFVERRYKPCADDLATGQPRTGDLCWETDNATLALGGRSSELVRIAGTNRWRPADDDGSRVERLTGAGNGARDGEHWLVTTTDGTKHFFGLRPEAGSTWTLPVFGNDADEPCKRATFADSFCTQAWRWNLDRSVDVRGNTIDYTYAPETNAYGLNEGASKQAYVRGGVLLRADYGGRAGSPHTGRVLFDSTDRCTVGATCARTAMPDVPWDLHCDTATCAGRHSPTFWSTKRLAKVRTEAHDGTAFKPVDEWTLAHSFPAPGDGTTPALWLDSVTHTGRAGGGTASTPPVQFVPTGLQNRVNTASDGLPPMTKFRIGTVRNGTGGETNVVYDRDCSAASLPAPHANSTRCFPIRWTPDGEFTPRDDWFAKYTVARVTEDDRVGGGPLMVTNYEYLGGAGWLYEDDLLLKPEYRTWSRYAGYEKVRVTRGDHTVAGVKRTSSTFLYHRGLHGDHQPGGARRTAFVTDSQGTRVEDSPELTGFLRESIVHDGIDGPEVGGTIREPYRRETARDGARSAHQVDVAVTRTRTAVAGGAPRTTRTEHSYDGDGQVVAVNDLGDTSTAADDQCRRTEYARDESAWRIDMPSRELTVAAACSETPVFPRDAVSEERTYYDGKALGVPPGDGRAVEVQRLDSFDGSTPRFVTAAKSTLDEYGRVTAAEDALGRTTRTAYVPANGAVRSTTVTDPKGYRTTTTVDPLRGQPTKVEDVDNARATQFAYDALGRRTAVWAPGRRTSDRPDERVTYAVRDSGPSWVATESLTANEGAVVSYALVDGFQRPRQTQSPGSGGGRVFTATHYDSRGLAVKETGPEHTTGEPSGDLLSVPDAQAYRQTLTTYDGAGRATVSAFHSLADEQWRTTTAHHGDSVSVTPPAGGTATRTYSDARGRVARRLEFRGPRPEGDHDATSYAYTDAGRLASMRDTLGNEWTYEYDAAGRQIAAHDPDTGTTRTTYDPAGQRTSVTDGRGRTLAYAYDLLGRRTAVHAGTLAGAKLAGWTYDTLAGGKGLQSGSTRHSALGDYKVDVTGYDAATGRPTGERVVIPGGETGLGGTYETQFEYFGDGSVDRTHLPRLGDLEGETVFHDYDALGLPSATYGDANYVTATAYSWFGQRTQLTLGDEGNEAWQTLSYDDATRRLVDSHTQRRKSPYTVNHTTYGYDDAGNVTRISDRFAGAAAEDRCFRYDHARRLTEAWTSTAGCDGAAGSALGGPAPYWTSLEYDAIGNRTKEVRHATAGDTTRTYAYPQAGRPQPHTLRSVETRGPGGTTTESYEYDAGGNTKALRGQALEWDDERHLKSMGTSAFVYDADGNRLVRRDSGSRTLFLSSGELRVGGGSARGTRFYDHGGESVAVRTAAGLAWLAGDHHGTDEVLIDADTLDAVKRRSDPFGNPRGAQPTWPGSRGFVGGTTDPTGLTHLGAREYDPAIGRFISADPIIDTSDPQQINGYAYANNSPVTFSDPDGLLAARCPDGECRFGGYKKNQSPAKRFNVLRKIFNGRGTRCADGARSCRAVRGFQPAKPKSKPKVAPAAPKRSWFKRVLGIGNNASAGLADSDMCCGIEAQRAAGKGIWGAAGYDASNPDESAAEYKVARRAGDVISVVQDAVGPGKLRILINGKPPLDPWKDTTAYTQHESEQVKWSDEVERDHEKPFERSRGARAVQGGANAAEKAAKYAKAVLDIFFG